MKTLFTAAAPWAVLAFALGGAADPAVVGLGALEGAGWVAYATCLACLTGGATLLLTGWGAVTAFIWSSGSLLAATACAAACADAVL